MPRYNKEIEIQNESKKEIDIERGIDGEINKWIDIQKKTESVHIYDWK